jgi:hypothetical protein
MPEPVATATADNKTPTDYAALIDGPPEEEFWEKYNKRLEFPLATVATILLHVLVGAVLVFVLVRLMDKENDKSGVPVKLVDMMGLDDAGAGSAGSGGVEEPIFKRDGDMLKAAIDSLPDPSKLPEIKENMQKTIKYLDPTGNLPISDANAAAYASLDESVRNKLLGGRQGAGKGGGTGFDGTQGKGPGGTGADSTLGRNMRWVLRFNVRSGRDYVSQLNTMKARILVPIPNSPKCFIIDNLDNPSPREATDADLRALGDQVKFSDHRRDAVQSVAGALGLDFRPDTFWAFFPKDMEDELARKETSYRNRRADDIEETIFTVSVEGGRPVIKVVEQKIKR